MAPRQRNKQLASSHATPAVCQNQQALLYLVCYKKLVSFKMVSFPAGDCKCHGVWRWNSELSDRVGKRKASLHKAPLLNVGCTTLTLTQGGATPPFYFECPTASNSILLKLFSPAVFWFVHSDSLGPCKPETFPTSSITVPIQSVFPSAGRTQISTSWVWGWRHSGKFRWLMLHLWYPFI